MTKWFNEKRSRMLSVEDEDEDPVFLRKICVQRKIIMQSITVLIFLQGIMIFVSMHMSYEILGV